MMETASGIISLVAAFCLAFVVLHPDIQEGIILKTGMILMAMALMVTFAITMVEPHYDANALLASGFILRLGILVVCIGVMMKANRAGKRKRMIRGEQRTKVHLYNMMAPVHDLVDFLKDEPKEKVK